MTRTAIATLNVGGSSLHPKSRESFEAAAERWGCEFVVFTEPIGPPGIHVWWQKTYVIEQLALFDRVLQIDADCLIRDDAPSPFPLVPDFQIGVVHEIQKPNALGALKAIRSQMAYWVPITGLDPVPPEKYANAGFAIYSPAVHLPFFRRLRQFGRLGGFSGEACGDQPVMSMLLHRRGLAYWLPSEWNSVGAVTRHRLDLPPRMATYIYHFTGKDKLPRIEATIWKTNGATA